MLLKKKLMIYQMIFHFVLSVYLIKKYQWNKRLNIERKYKMKSVRTIKTLKKNKNNLKIKINLLMKKKKFKNQKMLKKNYNLP